jgi:hypothetical protein
MLSDGVTHTFENQASLMLLDKYCDGCSGVATNGVQVIQHPANGLETQQWTLHSQGNGYFTMVSVQSGMWQRRDFKCGSILPMAGHFVAGR